MKKLVFVVPFLEEGIIRWLLLQCYSMQLLWSRLFKPIMRGFIKCMMMVYFLFTYAPMKMLYVPWSLIIGSALTTGGLIAGGVQNKRNRKSQENQNQKDRDFQREMADRQTAETDRRWMEANQYNSPEQQMQRLREADLNPHLVYGSGDLTSNTQAIADSTPFTGSQPAPRDDYSFVGDSLKLMQAAVMQEEQVSNMRKQGEVLDKEALLKQAQTAKTLTENARDKFDLSQAEMLNDITVRKAIADADYQEASVALVSAETGRISVQNAIDVDRNKREELANSQNIAKSIQDMPESEQRILESKSKIELNDATRQLYEDQMYQIDKTLEKLDTEIKKGNLEAELLAFQLEMKKDGIEPSDPSWMRQLRVILEKYGIH